MYLVLVVFCLLLAAMARDIASTSARILNLLQRQESRLKHRTRDSDAGYNASVDKLRRKEYPATKGSIYLDHAGTTLPAKSLMNAFARDMTSALYGNPHSASEPSQRSTHRVDDARARLLQFFRADPEEFDLVFVPNATAGIKLVAEGIRALPDGYLYAYHEACHTSIVGVREEAKQSVCLDDGAIQSWIDGKSPFDQTASATLFSYTAQSHMNGRRYPMEWSRVLKDKNRDEAGPLYTLLDASSYAATSQLDLSHPSFTADFVVLSLYKIFGFPNLGALIVRRSAEPLFDNRKYFGGGTVDMVICRDEQWHASKARSLHDRLEDGTLPFHSIIAAGIAMDVHQKLFGSMTEVGRHTSFLAARLHNGLRQLRHGNGKPVCFLYTAAATDAAPLGTGPLVSFNVLNSAGAWVSLGEFEKLAALKNVFIRTGSLCSPGGTAAAVGLTPWELKRLYASGYRCGADNDVITGKPTGVIRASLGAMSTVADIDGFLRFMEEFFVEPLLEASPSGIKVAKTGQTDSQLSVESITVFPIKSCAGFVVPKGMSWEVRPEGLAWDREWCLIHKTSGQALSQKRYPQMAHLHPEVDLDSGVLRVRYTGGSQKPSLAEITVPLSQDIRPNDERFREKYSQVCGDEVSALMYCCEQVNDFFTEALDVPCVLARFPAGGSARSGRTMKANMRQPSGKQASKAKSPPTPPESDNDMQEERKLLLSNESPILMVHKASVDALNRDVVKRGGQAVSEKVFRANIIVGSKGTDKGQAPYAEENWSRISIDSQNFELLGPCQRCQMVCVNPRTGEKGQEPYVTLAKTRRSRGKVFFGMHMRHRTPRDKKTREEQYPTIQVGQTVTVDT
jgi:molybdenum cofactor sulfurtransferase